MFGVFPFGVPYFGQPGGASVDSTASPAGVAMTFAVGSVVASGTVVQTIGGIRQPVRYITHGIASPRGVSAIVRSGRVIAVGSSVASPTGVAVTAVVGGVSLRADGSAQPMSAAADVTAGHVGVNASAIARLAGVAWRAKSGHASVDGTDEGAYYRMAVMVPDEIDTAWATLQRARDDEETLILLGVFDA